MVRKRKKSKGVKKLESEYRTAKRKYFTAGKSLKQSRKKSKRKKE